MGTTEGPITNHPYQKIGSYPVTVRATDKYGRKGTAKLTQDVIDPKIVFTNLPPTAHITSDPPESRPKQPVKFDASKSHDQHNKPCVKFLWDFGDGSPKKTTDGPITHHPYKKVGVYPVTVQVTDKLGQTADAGLQQRVSEPGPEDPYVALNSTPNPAKIKEPVRFDASDSVDCDGDPCKNFIWDFGDNTPRVHTTTPVTNHAYDEPGSYPVTVTATDKYGRHGDAQVTQRVIDPKNPKKKGPPTAHVTSDPPESRPKQPVTFDASKSHDFENKPCVKFVWDFGDGSPQKTTKEPTTKHPYQKPGVYPVTVEVTDKYGQTANARLQQRCIDPAVYDNDPSRGPKGPKKKNYGGKKPKTSKNPNDPKSRFSSKGQNDPYDVYGNESKEPDMPQDAIGDEFRNVVHDAVSKAIMDPNPQNKKAGTKTAAVLSKLDPSFLNKMDPEAKRRYQFGLKPFKPKIPKELPANPRYSSGTKALHPVQIGVHVDANKGMILPDI